MVLNIHDSLKYSEPIAEIDQAMEAMTKGMCSPIPGVNFPLRVDFEIGRAWGDMIKVSKFNKDREKYLREWGCIK